MRQLELQEYGKSQPYRLSVQERDTLREVLRSLTIEPEPGERDAYRLRSGSTVGALEIGGLSVLIRPKIGIPQLLSLACYAMGAVDSQERRWFDFEEQPALPDTLAVALAAAARRAFARGLLHGYLTYEEALPTVRGRIRFDDQLRRRFGLPLPVEVRYDEFTDDILANRLVKAAVVSLGNMRLRSETARQDLGRIVGLLDNVTLVEFPPNKLPQVSFDRLNKHYRHVIGLSRLILRHSAFQSSRGTVRAAGFLIDMNTLFQEFVTQALRDELGVTDRELRSDENLPRGTSLALHGRLPIEPDLSWWDGGVCTFVGDAKYKNVSGESVPSADLYQLLAYATALDLPGGLLVYAQGEADRAEYEVRHAGKRLEVTALDLGGTLDDVLASVRRLAQRVRELRNQAHGLKRAA
ncbi:MAG: restriction endonuclease [Chloroflexota bacterium]|nr:restriction endonuclease [Chloroflexota bacterium]